MHEMATRHPCPVCLGVTMDVLKLGDPTPDRALVLDRCSRCGGVWLDAGEVQRLRGLGEESLPLLLAQGATTGRMPCHSCHAYMGRNAASCPGCGWRNVLDCPTCSQPMATAVEQGVKLDVCRKCRGVWFDHAEIASVWRLELRSALDRRSSRLGATGVDATWVLLDALAYSPGIVIEGARLGAYAAARSAEALAAAPEAAVAAVEVAGEASAGVFEVVVEIIGGIFS